jgi:protein required for attachment to host cells
MGHHSEAKRAVMLQHRSLLYIVADGGTARLIERLPKGGFRTLRTLDGRAQLAIVREQLRDEHAGRSIESANSARHAVGREDDYRRAKAAFAKRTAEAVKRMLAEGEWSGVVLAAPARLVQVFRDELEGEINLVRTLAKDLTKTPDHELGRWLDAAGAGRQAP